MSNEKIQELNENVTIKKELEMDFVDKHRSKILATLFGVPVIGLFLYPVFFSVVGTGYFIDTFAFVFIYAALAMTLNLEVGYLGLPNFGKVAFVMVGAYAYAITEDAGYQLLGMSVWATGLLMATIFTGLSGVLLTLPTLRLKEDYFAIVTIVAGEILRLVANNEPDLGGFSGFPVTNIIFKERNVDAKLGGIFFEPIPLLLFLLLLAFSLGLFLYYRNKFAKIYDEENKILDYALQKSSTYTIILAIIIIYLNFVQTFHSSSLVLDVFVIGFPILIILFRSLFDIIGEVNDNMIYGFYGVIAGIAIFDFLIGVGSSGNASAINVVNWYFMILTAVIMLFVYVVLEEIYFSPFGRALRAIREDDTSAVAIGKGLFDFRLKGLIISNALTGLTGAIFAWLLTNVTPQTFLPLLTFLLYIMVIIGGSGNNKGVIFGAIVVQLLIQTTRRLSTVQIYYPFSDRLVNPFNWALIIVGVTLIVFLIYAPDGIFPEQKDHNEYYLDMLYLNEESAEEIQENPVLEVLMKLSGTNPEEITKEELY